MLYLEYTRRKTSRVLCPPHNCGRNIFIMKTFSKKAGKPMFRPMCPCQDRDTVHHPLPSRWQGDITPENRACPAVTSGPRILYPRCLYRSQTTPNEIFDLIHNRLQRNVSKSILLRFGLLHLNSRNNVCPGQRVLTTAFSWTVARSNAGRQLAHEGDPVRRAFPWSTPNLGGVCVRSLCWLPWSGTVCRVGRKVVGAVSNTESW